VIERHPVIDRHTVIERHPVIELVEISHQRSSQPSSV